MIADDKAMRKASEERESRLAKLGFEPVPDERKDPFVRPMARHPYERGQIVEILTGKRAGQRHPVLDVYLAYQDDERPGVSIRDEDTELFYGLDEVREVSAALDELERLQTSGPMPSAAVSIKTPARTVTRKRAFGTQYHGGAPETAVTFRSGWADGAWVVIWKDDTIAHCTDKWMAEMIMSALTKRTDGGSDE